MSLNIYNTLTRTKEEFLPLNPPFVGMYVCGPTVYGHSHLGHARSYITFDVIYRYLTFKGYKVRYVQNITDVGHLVGDRDFGDDKIQKQAKTEKMEPVEIAYKYETSYFEDMDSLNLLRPSISCRATGHIPEMIDHIESLIKKDFAYMSSEGNIYFNVRKFAGYGKLTNRTLEDAQEGERIERATDKKNVEDFALWKKADQGHLMQWNSPWGKGYPGWHIVQ
jgi:cysteinyl-tRNA synthetase